MERQFLIDVLIGDEFVLLYGSSLDILFGQNVCRFSIDTCFGMHRAYSYHLWKLSSFDIHIVKLI